MGPRLKRSTSGDEGWCLGIFRWEPPESTQPVTLKLQSQEFITRFERFEVFRTSIQVGEGSVKWPYEG